MEDKVAYIVCQPCIGVKDHACVDVCPVNCFYEWEDQILIHPGECIDCGACIPACPVEAIFEESDVPERWKSFIEKNAVPFINPDHGLRPSPQRNEWEAEKVKEGSEAYLYYQKYSEE